MQTSTLHMPSSIRAQLFQVSCAAPRHRDISCSSGGCQCLPSDQRNVGRGARFTSWTLCARPAQHLSRITSYHRIGLCPPQFDRQPVFAHRASSNTCSQMQDCRITYNNVGLHASQSHVVHRHRTCISRSSSACWRSVAAASAAAASHHASLRAGNQFFHRQRSFRYIRALGHPWLTLKSEHESCVESR